jgi:GDPmannose 4,6-dehydratase
VRKALITGVTGQDGSFLARHLLQLGYEVLGSSSSPTPNLKNIESVGVKGNLPVVSLDNQDFEAVDRLLIKHKPTHIFALGSLSSVGKSFGSPLLTEHSIFRSTEIFLDSIKRVNPEIKFFHPSSSEMFGNIEDIANEDSPCNPVSPYGIWKLKAHQLIRRSRGEIGLSCVSGILFNHESSLRGPDFFTRKLITGAVDIYRGQKNFIEFGNLDGVRDWGWAPDYVVAMEMIINQENLRDFVIATGIGHSLQFLVAETFSILGLDWEKHVKIEPTNFRPLDIKRSVGDPDQAEKNLLWKNEKTIQEILHLLIESELNRKS